MISKNVTNILGIILVILMILFVIVIVLVIIKIDPEQKEKEVINNELTTDKMMELLRYSHFHLNKSEKLEINSITDEYMVVFALDYMNVVGGYDIKYMDEYIQATILELQQAVSYLFDRQINFSNTNFEVNGDTVLVPDYPVGTDVETYKLKSKVYNEADNTYTSYIDVLGVSPSQYSEIMNVSVTEYPQEDVIKTMIFKYREVNGRKVLLAYNAIWNI